MGIMMLTHRDFVSAGGVDWKGGDADRIYVWFHLAVSHKHNQVTTLICSDHYLGGLFKMCWTVWLPSVVHGNENCLSACIVSLHSARLI
jgi:hypothetical protein